MQEIQFDLGKNIVETARQSGVPEFAASITAGRIHYSVNSIPAGIPARFTRPSYEIVWEPLFAFTMYADRDISPDDLVDAVALQLENQIRSHAEAHAFVERTIAQFQNGKWQRYLPDDWPHVTGRSSYLDQHGKMDGFALDPAFKIPADEWQAVASERANWYWIGDGVLAQLTVSYAVYRGDDFPTYQIALSFELEEITRRRSAENEARELREGDAKGLNATARATEDKKENDAYNSLLEQNALERGDAVVPRR
jgi:hypothetical protein